MGTPFCCNTWCALAMMFAFLVDRLLIEAWFQIKETIAAIAPLRDNDSDPKQLKDVARGKTKGNKHPTGAKDVTDEAKHSAQVESTTKPEPTRRERKALRKIWAQMTKDDMKYKINDLTIMSSTRRFHLYDVPVKDFVLAIPLEKVAIRGLSDDACDALTQRINYALNIHNTEPRMPQTPEIIAELFPIMKMTLEMSEEDFDMQPRANINRLTIKLPDGSEQVQYNVCARQMLKHLNTEYLAIHGASQEDVCALNDIAYLDYAGFSKLEGYTETLKTNRLLKIPAVYNKRFPMKEMTIEPITLEQGAALNERNLDVAFIRPPFSKSTDVFDFESYTIKLEEPIRAPAHDCAMVQLDVPITAYPCEMHGWNLNFKGSCCVESQAIVPLRRDGSVMLDKDTPHVPGFFVERS